MKIVLVLSACVVVAMAAPLDKEAPVPIIQYDEQRDEFGQYALSFKTGDGTTVTRQGELKPTADGKDHVLIQSGSQSYTAPDGTFIKESWTANEDGYHAVGDHLPVSPSA